MAAEITREKLVQTTATGTEPEMMLLDTISSGRK